MTIAQAVEKIIQSKPFILEALQDGIINYSSLSKHLKKDVETKLGKIVQEGAIVMSLRRMDLGRSIQLNSKLNNLINNLGDILVRSNLVDYTFRNSETLIGCQRKLIDKINELNDIFYTISRGVYETTFVLSDMIKNDIPIIFEGEKLISYSFGLSSITIKLPAENTEQPGLYYYIFRKLAWENINILEVVSTSNEFTILLKDHDIDKAFSVIKQLKN